MSQLVVDSGVPASAETRRTWKPSSALGWWAFGLGVSTVVLGLVATSLPSLVMPLLESLAGPGQVIRIPIGFTSIMLEGVLAIAAIVTGVMALVRGDRAWLVWAALIPSVLVGGFWILFAIGEVLFPH